MAPLLPLLTVLVEDRHVKKLALMIVAGVALLAVAAPASAEPAMEHGVNRTAGVEHSVRDSYAWHRHWHHRHWHHRHW
jgi:hypothetical protein